MPATLKYRPMLTSYCDARNVAARFHTCTLVTSVFCLYHARDMGSSCHIFDITIARRDPAVVAVQAGLVFGRGFEMGLGELSGAIMWGLHSGECGSY